MEIRLVVLPFYSGGTAGGLAYCFGEQSYSDLVSAGHNFGDLGDKKKNKQICLAKRPQDGGIKVVPREPLRPGRLGIKSAISVPLRLAGSFVQATP